MGVCGLVVTFLVLVTVCFRVEMGLGDSVFSGVNLARLGLGLGMVGFGGDGVISIGIGTGALGVKFIGGRVGFCGFLRSWPEGPGM